jgi:coenzyme F420 hydrogenase subunit beta
MAENKTNHTKQQYEYSFEYLQKKLEGKKDSFGLLMREIIRPGICTRCGTCASVCPVLQWDHLTGQPKLIGQCSGCGICYNQCPRTITDPKQLIGEFKSAYSVVTKLPEVLRGNIQDGGTVTSILYYLFNEHLIDAAIVTMRDPSMLWYPAARIITSKEETISAAGSIYSHSQTVEALMDAIRKDYRAIAFVGTPCNIDAVDKMLNSPTGMLKYFMRSFVLKIGLFCMDSFAAETLYPFFRTQGIDLSKITKMNISKGRFNIFEAGNEEPVKSFTIKELDKFKSSSCNFCTDLTSEKADISVGSVGSAPKKNTVFARSGIGAEIIEDAAKKDYIAVESYTSSININSLLALAKLKKVSQYNVQQRKVFIVRDYAESKEIDVKLKVEAPLTKLPFDTVKALNVTWKLYKKLNSLDFTLSNSIGYTLEGLKIKIAAIENQLEKNPWITTINELFPYEKVDINYPFETKSKEEILGNVLVEAVLGAYGKIFSKVFKITQEEKK